MAARYSEAQRRKGRMQGRLPLALYAAWLSMHKLAGRLLRRLGLTFPQYLVLQLLADRGQMTVSAIGDALLLDSATLSPLLRRMEAAGLLERRRGVADQRWLLVSLTPGGRQVREDAYPLLTRVVQASGLTEYDNDGLVRWLDLLSKGLQREA